MAKTKQARKASDAIVIPCVPECSDRRRHHIAFEATLRMDALFDAVAEQISRINTADEMDVVSVIQALAIRGAALAGEVMEALSESSVLSPARIKEMRSTIYGRE